MARLNHESISRQSRNRRFPRRDVNTLGEFSPINIKQNTATNIGTIRALIKNLSPMGLYCEMPGMYRVGTRFQVRLTINETIVSFYAIVWRVDLKQDAAGPVTYGHGLKITTASEDTLHTILSYINSP